MTKPEALNLLTVNGLTNHGAKHPIWSQVFEFYVKETGDKTVKIGCSSCHTKILRWLRN